MYAGPFTRCTGVRDPFLFVTDPFLSFCNLLFFCTAVLHDEL